MEGIEPGAGHRRPGLRLAGSCGGIVGLLVAAVVFAAPAGGREPARGQPVAIAFTTDTSAGTSAGAEARAKRARARVEALVEEYTDAERAVARGLTRLSKSFEAADAAVVDADQAAAARAAAEVQRGQDIRAIYASGGSAGLTATLLAADSPTELLWWQSTNQRLLSGVMTSNERSLRSADADSRLAERRAAEAERAADEHLAALNELQAEADRAESALQDARLTLRRLDRQAKQARAAEQARAELARAQRTARADRQTATGKVTALGIPTEYELAYRAAAGACPGLRWTLLAAVGQVESGHGRNVGPSSAGAKGPMQFMPATFAAYGVDGDGDRVVDIWDAEDAIFSAARYLCATGLRDTTRDSAARDRAALYAYNRAGWYVDLVLSTEQSIIYAFSGGVP
ncbi:lytic murein transglycosylase [Kineosporia sp. NBRC 101677]|uniref:lytic transglycosylase domain-containing protein n=1 Tax=Kineosporia sp. NBRC 101677 TaxID=3032197 RepID=UPI0025556755|nr:lytic murein transglycosylase [Kineosporia sp. NBRC 101677]